MVSRLEWLLAVAILFFLLKGYDSTSVTHSGSDDGTQKELEFQNASFYEVNQSNLLGHVRVLRLERSAEKTAFTDFYFSSPEVRLLHAKQATQRNRQILLEGNATFVKEDGAQYYANHISYDRQERVVKLEGDVRVEGGIGSIVGERLEYDLATKEVSGQRVRARYRVAPK